MCMTKSDGQSITIVAYCHYKTTLDVNYEPLLLIRHEIEMSALCHLP